MIATYQGPADVRRISKQDWAARKVDAETVEFSADNAFTADVSELPEAALAILRAEPGITLTEEASFDGLTNAQLRNQLAARGLATDGKKEELIGRLNESGAKPGESVPVQEAPSTTPAPEEPPTE